MIQKNDVKIGLLQLDKQIQLASSQFDSWAIEGIDYADPSWIIESCYIQLLVLVESLGLGALQQMVQSEYLKTKSSKEGFNLREHDFNGEPFSSVLGDIRCFKEGLDCLFPEKTITEITRDVLQILRDIHYSITDPKVFGRLPSNEADVHLRIEAILKCVFPDLKHKPMLTKQIKNFEPDTGIPSINTLIEYKFLSQSNDVPTIADQILADTRGYVSKDWKRFIYVIYETNRFRKESEWDQFLRESGVLESTSVVVLSGEPPTQHSKGKSSAKKLKSASTENSVNSPAATISDTTNTTPQNTVNR